MPKAEGSLCVAAGFAVTFCVAAGVALVLFITAAVTVCMNCWSWSALKVAIFLRSVDSDALRVGLNIGLFNSISRC